MKLHLPLFQYPLRPGAHDAVVAAPRPIDVDRRVALDGRREDRGSAGGRGSIYTGGAGYAARLPGILAPSGPRTGKRQLRPILNDLVLWVQGCQIKRGAKVGVRRPVIRSVQHAAAGGRIVFHRARVVTVQLRAACSR